MKHFRPITLWEATLGADAPTVIAEAIEEMRRVDPGPDFKERAARLLINNIVLTIDAESAVEGILAEYRERANRGEGSFWKWKYGEEVP